LRPQQNPRSPIVSQPRYEEEIIERTVPVSTEIEYKYVEVPQVHKRTVHKPVEHIVEKVVEVPKLEIVEEIIEKYLFFLV